MRRHQIARLFSRSRLCVRGYEPSTGFPASLPPWILPEPAGGSASRPKGRPKKGQAPKPARPPTALQAQLLALQAEAATMEGAEWREGRESGGADAAICPASSPPPSSSSLPVRRGILVGFFRPARVAWHPPLALPQRGGGKKAENSSSNGAAVAGAAAEAAAPASPPPPPNLLPPLPLPLSTSNSSPSSPSPGPFLLLPAGWHPPLVLLDRRLLPPAALGIPKKHKRGGVGRWHPPLAWPPRAAAAAAAAAAAEFGKRVRIARYAPVAAAAKCGRCKYCLFPGMRQACMLRRAEAERRRAEEEVAALEAEADAAEAEAEKEEAARAERRSMQ